MSRPVPEPLRARRQPGATGWVLMAGAGIAVAWATFRLVAALAGGHPVLWAYLGGIGLLVWQLVSAAVDRPYRATPEAAAELARAQVVVLVPAYNEDDAILEASLRSLLRQTHLPAAVSVVDDGSTTGDYAGVRDRFLADARAAGVQAAWQRTANGGKRHAQVSAARAFPDAELYLTIDSDTQLDARAIEEALQPMEDPEVQSVAGTILVTNYRTNLLTRMQEVWFVSMQFVDRAALSRMGSVLVNSGPLAVYRAAVLWDNVEDYLGETLFGRPVHTSDDSLLTLYAQQRGRTVHQTSAFAFSHMPTTFDGHRRQQLRWMRGSFMRSRTRFARLPLSRFSFWIHLVRWMQYAAVTAALAVVLVSGALLRPSAIVTCVVIVGAAQLLVAAPYLSLRRSDQTTAQRLVVVAVAPLVGLWSLTVLRVLRWYAMATVSNVSWGTRKTIEVTA